MMRDGLKNHGFVFSYWESDPCITTRYTEFEKARQRRVLAVAIWIDLCTRHDDQIAPIGGMLVQRTNQGIATLLLAHGHHGRIGAVRVDEGEQKGGRVVNVAAVPVGGLLVDVRARRELASEQPSARHEG